MTRSDEIIAILTSGIFLIAQVTLVYPCKPLENELSRILYTWSLLDAFLTFVRPKDVIRLKIRLFFACTAVSIQARLFKYSSARINTPLEVQVYALSRKPSPVTAL